MKRLLRAMTITLVVLVSLSFTTGCATVKRYEDHKELRVETKVSETVFMEPVSPDKRIIFVDIRNTSDQEIEVTQPILAVLQNRGYTITDNPDEARFMLQANILQAGRTQENDRFASLQAGYGSGLVGIGIGLNRGYKGSRSFQNAGLAGAGMALAGTWLDAKVKNVYYNMITDLRIRERPLDAETVTQSQSNRASTGQAATQTQKIAEHEVQWKTYETRVISSANQINLTFDKARAELERGLIKTISGIF